MKNLHQLSKYRCTDPSVVAYFGGIGDETCGCFIVPSPIDKAEMRVIASASMDWDHVSVSRANRPPNWREMCHVKNLFFGDETVMQLHVPKSDHVNDHPHCLHLWRPQKNEIPRPPSWMVGGDRDEALRQYDNAAALGGSNP